MKSLQKKTYIFFSIIAILFSSLILNAESEGILNKLLAPGPLMIGHKDLEGTACLKCHEAGKGISDTKCMSCHKDIKKFVDSKNGFHGLNTDSCIKCHSDHKGREFDSTQFDSKTFDHFKKTGYALDGKHSEIKCLECHKDKKPIFKGAAKTKTTYLGVTATCVSCHKKQDIHFYKGEFAKKDCNVCHNNKSWKENIKFNHNTDTKYKLIEKHSELKCNDCHQPDKKIKTVMKYAWPNLNQAQCLACHQDFHKKNLGSKFSDGKCTTCHTQQNWKIEKFNHEVTPFKLNGKHAEIKCIACHNPNKKIGGVLPDIEIKKLNFTGLNSKCLSCHDDYHKFGPLKSKKLGDLNQCTSCHNEKEWKTVLHFDHNVNTQFPIDGQHKELKCSVCHLPEPKNLKTDPKKLNLIKVPTYRWTQLDSKTCESCHKNPHIGVFNAKLLAQKCNSCHTTEGWNITKTGSGFDHSNTRFALTGAHKTTSCADCHGPSNTKQVFKFKSFESKFCIDCHQNIHTNQMSPKFAETSCTLCHITQNFKERLEFDHAKTNYVLLGAHEKLKCSECHTAKQSSQMIRWPNFKSKDHAQQVEISLSKFLFPEIKTQKCMACHSDYHKGQLSSHCTECHQEKSWKPTVFVHNKQSRYILRDKHETVDCNKCHVELKETVHYKNQVRNVVQYKPLNTLCVDCHKDPHKGNFGRSCNECHTEKMWKTTKDFHKNFTLSGVHYSLDCAECHKDGKKLSGLSQQCLSCHQKDDIHNGMLPNCNICHTQHFWEASHFRHSLTQFPLRGAHRTIECSECHTNGVYKGLSSTCSTCHMADYTANPSSHTSGNTNCSECHRNTFSFKRGN